MPHDPKAAAIEAAIADRHVIQLRYTPESGGGAATHTVEPLAIRRNVAGHTVLWVFDRGAGHIEQLLWDRIGADVTDTGEVFEPREWEPAPA